MHCQYYLLQHRVLLLGGEAEVALLGGAEFGGLPEFSNKKISLNQFEFDINTSEKTRLFFKLLLPLLDCADVVPPEVLKRLDELLVGTLKLEKIFIHLFLREIPNFELIFYRTILSLSSSIAAMSFPNSFSEEAMMISSSVCRMPMHSNLKSWKIKFEHVML